MPRPFVSTSLAARVAVACAVIAQLIVSTPAIAATEHATSDRPPLLASAAAAVAATHIDPPVETCVQQLKSAKSRRTNGRAMTTVGAIAAAYGYVVLTSSLGGHCEQAGTCSSHDRDVAIGAGGLAGGLTLAGFGIEKAHRGDADARSLVAQDACISSTAVSLAIADAVRAPRSSAPSANAETQATSAWTRVVADAKARRSTGYKELALGVVAIFVGDQLLIHSSSDNGQALLGASISIAGLATTIAGHLKARDAGHELDALTARGPSGAQQSVGVSLGPGSGSMTWRITW